MGHHILLIEDDLTIFEIVRAILKDFTIVHAASIAEAKKLVGTENFKALLLDLNLPDGDGLRFLSELKTMEHVKNVPMIILSGETGISHKVMAFEYGVDDYITKPFDPLEFRSRIVSKIKKEDQKLTESTTVIFENLTIDLHTFRASLRTSGKETDLGLTPLEIKILFLLSQKMEQVFSREQIMSFLWKDTFIGDRTVDSHIAHLRQKLKDAPILIDTVKGVGYRATRK